jgi:hypothetical protein
MFRRKKDSFKFSGRSHSVKGITSVIIGCFSLITFIVISFISSLSGGNGGLVLGIIGLGLLALSVTGFVLGVKSCKEKEIHYTAPIIGLTLNGILSVIYFVLYLVGLL